jgi:ribonuclease HII
VSEHKADRNFAVVSAASIIAKVERDREIAELAKTLGFFGSGYPSDPRTVKFLEKCCQDLEEYPEYVRKSWRPARKIRDLRGSKQATLM